jgi:hypothetical protein
MAIRVMVERTGDMHPTRKLRVTQQSDGDVIVSITQDGWPIGDTDLGSEKDRAASVEFCVSGGRSRRTHEALMALLVAIELDNEERPIR